jgi:hypothetical protein
LIKNEIQGFVLWEPHYQAFMEFDDVEILDIEHQDEYSWFLCLISPKQYVDKHGHIASRLLSTLRTAVDECGTQRSEAITEYMSFLHIEFTGIGETQLRQLLESRKHHFGVGRNVDEFQERLDTLAGRAPYGFGAGSLKTSLWPGL